MNNESNTNLNPYQQNQSQFYSPQSQQPPYAPQPPQPPTKKRKRWPLFVALAILVFGFVVCIAANNSPKTVAQVDQATAAPKTSSKTTPSKPVPTAKPKPTFTTFSDGTYEVGKNIKPGTYRTRAGSDNCYYSRLSGFDGAVSSIISNANTNAPAIVTIAPTDKGFTSTNCGTWTADLSQITKSKTSFADGMYIVGTDIDPGTYKNSGGSGCYYARLSTFSGATGDVIANNNTDTQAIVTIAPDDKGFQADRCGTWTKE